MRRVDPSMSVNTNVTMPEGNVVPRATHPHSLPRSTCGQKQFAVALDAPAQRAHRLAVGLQDAGRGYRRAMTIHPNQPASNEADPDKQSSPAGVVEDLEEEARRGGRLDRSAAREGLNAPRPGRRLDLLAPIPQVM